MQVARGNVRPATAVSQIPTDFPQVPNITSRASRGANAFTSCENTQLAKFLVSLSQQFGNWRLTNLLESPAQRSANIRSNGIIVPVRTARRLWDNFVHNFEFQQILRSQLECLGCFGCMPPVSPQNRGTRFGTDHRVVSVLENQHAICDPDPQRAARSAFANDGSDNRDTQRHHLTKIDSDCF